MHSFMYLDIKSNVVQPGHKTNFLQVTWENLPPINIFLQVMKLSFFFFFLLKIGNYDSKMLDNSKNSQFSIQPKTSRLISINLKHH